MALLRPSLTLVLDLDERAAGKATVLEINRSYAHIGTPVVRTHAAESEDAPVRNTARLIVNMGTYAYLDRAAEGADERWDDIVAPWLRNMLHKVGNNMKVFNDRQRKIGLPEVAFDTLEVELQGGQLVVALRPEPCGFIEPDVAAIASEARALRAEGAFAGAVRVEAPTAEAYAAQRENAWEAWVVEHPEALEEPEPAVEAEADEPVPEKTREQLLAEDIEAKSYENTAVAPTDAPDLPRPARPQEDEPDPFTFPVDYRLWTVTFADGTTRTYDRADAAFAD
ncbi:hypothetical protein [uncultured Adlercreutzia sp.]|uniref:hypothetical protein n=1 Tax=uncultured Adlercreutzia sp. TaxID=875803 RepID=UPI0025CDE77B|nr:hypothetical protein [uncultured Adlercreutzia sp.]